METPLLADPRGAAHARMADLALRVELARPFREVIARCLAGATIDAGAFASGLLGRAIGGAELDRGVLGF